MDKTALKHKIQTLEGLTNEEKSALLELLNKDKKYGLVWEEHEERVDEELKTQIPTFEEVKEKDILFPDSLQLQKRRCKKLVCLV